MKIKKVEAWEVLDSRGIPTIEARVTLEDGSIGKAKVPAGASKGKHEAKELRDVRKKRFGGLGVKKAVDNVNSKIAKEIVGLDAYGQEKVDLAMLVLDGTDDKSSLGANAILSVSLATARASAAALSLPLYVYLSRLNPDFGNKFEMPTPLMNIINGGKHANWSFDLQEYMIIPASAKSTTEAIKMGAQVYHSLRKLLKEKNYALSVGDEGGFTPSLEDNLAPLEYITKAAEEVGYTLGKDIFLGIDAAASEFYHDKKYIFKKEKKEYSKQELLHFYIDLLEKYPIAVLEDPFSQDDWESFVNLTQVVRDKVQIVGDDLFATDEDRIRKGIEEEAANSVLIKPNQVGTLTEAIGATVLAKKNKLNTIVSHRSGETEDCFISDFAVAMGTKEIKTGAPARGERTAKYNRLIEIERRLKDKATFESPFRN